MRSSMSFVAKRELLVQVAPRYREATRSEKTAILDEFTAATGYSRKYAIRLLTKPISCPEPIKRSRPRVYGPEAQDALACAWSAANFICGKRLVPFLPELVASLERHGHLVLDDDVRGQLLGLSAATADRILQPLRVGSSGRGKSTTKAGRLLKHRVPVRTFAEWDDVQPGFFEADSVVHCGTSVQGTYLRSLVLTDIATGWTECLSLLNGGQVAVLRGLMTVRELLPFELLGIDTDNGCEFINEEVITYCERERITFSRGRPYKKNDQCFVEQKNGSIVRQLVGYDRYEGQVAHRQLTELYRAVRLYVNFFQPSMKLKTKRRTGSRVHRTYDEAQTPCQRLLASGALAPDNAQHLDQIRCALDPVRLLNQIKRLQDALWKHATTCPSAAAGPDDEAMAVIARFRTDPCMPDTANGAASDAPQGIAPTAQSAAAGRHRKYRRTGKSLGPRQYRTRADPFEAVRDELHDWFLAAPDATVKSLLERLQAEYPDEYPDNLLRTLQRRVSEWRKKVILELDETWLTDDPLTIQRHPVALRAVALDSVHGHEAESGICTEDP